MSRKTAYELELLDPNLFDPTSHERMTLSIEWIKERLKALHSELMALNVEEHGAYFVEQRTKILEHDLTMLARREMELETLLSPIEGSAIPLAM